MAPATRDDAAPTLTRRTLLAMLGAGCALPGIGLTADNPVLRRPIPATGETLPAVGLGTWQAFDTAGSGADFDAASATLAAFCAAGGALVDTSPMYGSAEERIGDILAARGLREATFLATKIWTEGTEEGGRQLARSRERMRSPVIDLVQVHNLLDAGAHWPTIAAAREAGKVRYSGLTHWQASAHAELERQAVRLRPDFIQVNYSLAEPEAARRLLPFARDAGIAVLVNRPFTHGGMLERAAGKPLPPQAVELGCGSAAQLFIKWVLGDPAVTTVLVGTRNPRHAAENVAAAAGPVPDAAQRRAIEAWFAAL